MLFLQYLEQKNNHVNKHSNNQLMTLSVGIYVAFYPYQSVHQSCLWDVGAFNQHNQITASTSKFIINLWNGSAWIRIFVRKCLTQFTLMKTSSILAFLQNLLQSFSILFCVTLEYIPMEGSLILGIWTDKLPIFDLLIRFWRYFLMTLSIMLSGYWFWNRTCLRFPTYKYLQKGVSDFFILFKSWHFY